MRWLDRSDSVRAVHLKAQMKMRILHVVPTYFPAIRYGGPTYSVHALYQSLAAAGHERKLALATLSGAVQ
jgi:glycogen synthase